MRTGRAVFAALLFAGGALPNQPQPTNPTALKQLSLEQLSSIEVTTPSKEPQSAMKAPVAIYVITGEDIRRSGATSIPEALRLAPGVEVARIDGNKWSIGIRGFGSRLARSVLVLMDGRTVYTTLFAGTYWEVQDTYMADIDRIEVIRGPGGTIWGPNAVDGVINVITKSSADTQGLQAEAVGGSYEQGGAGFRYGGSSGGNFSYRFYAKGFTRAPEHHPDKENFDDWRAAQGGFRLDWNRDPRNTVTVQGDIYAEKAGERVNPTSYTPPYSTIVDDNALLSGGNVLARWTHTTDGGGNTQVQIYYDRTNRSEPNVADYRNTFDADFLQRLNLPGRQEISWGLGGRFIGIDDPIVVSGLQFLPIKRNDWLATGFLQDEIHIVPNRLSLTLGTKLLKTNFTGVQPEPSARLAWTPSDRNTFWTAYTHAVRTPSDAEENFFLLGYIGQAAPGLQEFARFNANKAFAPEQLNGYEAGYRRLLRENLYIDAAGFYNHYHNLFSEELQGSAYIESTPTPAHILIPAQFRNGLYGDTTGFEVAPEWRPSSAWRLRASWSYLLMNLNKAPASGDLGTSPTIEGSSPRNQIEFQSNYDLSKRLQLDILYRFVSALPGEKIAAYSSADARFGWRVNSQFDVSLVGQNLLQPWHVEANGDPATLVGIVRSGYVKLTWTH